MASPTNAEPFVLTQGDRNNPLWPKLLEHFRDRLRVARETNDGDLDECKTALTRGRIRLLKELIALDQERPAP